MLGANPTKSHKKVLKTLAVWPMIGYLLPNSLLHPFCASHALATDQQRRLLQAQPVVDRRVSTSMGGTQALPRGRAERAAVLRFFGIKCP
jgi:hypothetical protein